MATSTPGLVGADGVIEWRDSDGRLHRAGGPARVFPSGREEWYRHGVLHRTDGPAVVHANGSVKYYRDGVRHRDDGPACIYVNGTEKWYRHGLRHRDDGPAAIYPDGRRIWFVDGEKVGSSAPRSRIVARCQASSSGSRSVLLRGSFRDRSSRWRCCRTEPARRPLIALA